MHRFTEEISLRRGVLLGRGRGEGPGGRRASRANRVYEVKAGSPSSLSRGARAGRGVGEGENEGGGGGGMTEGLPLIHVFW